MSDYTKVRTAYDLEQKYNLREVNTKLQQNENEIIKTTKTLDDFIDVTTDNIDNLQEQLDGKVDTYYYTGVPTLSNLPASDWDASEYPDHIGDLYFDESTGFTYIFENDNGYKWTRIKDDDITQAMARANAAYDTADGKRRVFVTNELHPTPTPPYDNGDLWVQDSQSDIFVCQVSRATGSYDEDDWILASKYTDNTVANAVIDELGGETTTVLSGTVVHIMEGYATYTNLATGGKTTINGDNITTGTIKSENYVEQSGEVQSGTSFDLTNGVIKSKGFNIDSSGNATLATGLVTIGDTGITLRTNESKINAVLTNDKWEVKDNEDNKLFGIGYDSTTGSSKGEMDNLTVKHYFVAANHRIEKYGLNNERTGWFYNGG